MEVGIGVSGLKGKRERHSFGTDTSEIKSPISEEKKTS